MQNTRNILNSRDNILQLRLYILDMNENGAHLFVENTQEKINCKQVIKRFSLWNFQGDCGKPGDEQTVPPPWQDLLRSVGLRSRRPDHRRDGQLPAGRPQVNPQSNTTRFVHFTSLCPNMKTHSNIWIFSQLASRSVKTPRFARLPRWWRTSRINTRRSCRRISSWPAGTGEMEGRWGGVGVSGSLSLFI